MQPQNDDWQQPDQRHAASADQRTDVANNPPLISGDQPQSTLSTAPIEMREGDDTVVRWQATEYIQRDKNGFWYLSFGVISVLLMVFAIFVIKSWTFALLIPVMATALLVYTLRPPSLLSYTLSRKGLHINDRLYSFESFREFGLVENDLENSVMLVPRRRFQPGVTVYFPVEVGEPIVDMLAARLPMREIKLDPVDHLVRFLRI